MIAAMNRRTILRVCTRRSLTASIASILWIIESWSMFQRKGSLHEGQ